MIHLLDLLVCHNAQRLPKDRLDCPLIKGETYQVLGLKACACGAIFVDVGLLLDRSGFEISCGCQRIMRDGTWWFDVKRFRPHADVFLWQKERPELSEFPEFGRN